MQRSFALGLLLAASAAPAARAQAPIEMGALRQLDAWTVGALSRGQGGMPESLWAASDAGLLGALFDRLPAVIESPAARALARRTLASTAEPPQGAAAEAARKRFSALARLGFADDVSVMAAGAGVALTDPNIAQFAAQAELARGRLTEACQRVRNASGAEPPAFVLRLRAYCAAAGGETAGADLALEVARSANADDSWFRSAIAAIRARPSRPPAARYDTSLNASLSLAANLPAGADPLGDSSTLALLTVARAQQAQPALRAQAAALAFRRGALSVAETREALRAALAPDPAAATGLIAAVRDAEATPGAVEAAAAIVGILNQSSAYEDFAAASLLFHDDIARLTVAPDAAATLTLARAAAAGGDPALAAKLADFAAQAGADPQGVARVRAAAALAGDDIAEIARRRMEAGAARDAAILAGLGPIDAAIRAFLLANPPQGGRKPDAALLAALNAAAGARALGETAILASLITAPGAHTLDADALSAVLRALTAVELQDAAKSLAIEALIGPSPS